jgi:hypothetical protein
MNDTQTDPDETAAGLTKVVDMYEETDQAAAEELDRLLVERGETKPGSDSMTFEQLMEHAGEIKYLATKHALDDNEVLYAAWLREYRAAIEDSALDVAPHDQRDYDFLDVCSAIESSGASGDGRIRFSAVGMQGLEPDPGLHGQSSRPEDSVLRMIKVKPLAAVGSRSWSRGSRRIRTAR